MKLAGLLLAAMILGLEWSIALFLEMLVKDQETKVFFGRLQYLGIYFSLPVFFWFIMVYTGRGTWITRNRMIALLIVPIVMNILAWTNDYHHLVWSGFVFDPDPSKNLLYYLRGPIYYFAIAYNYSLFIVIYALIISQAVSSKGILRRQAFTLLLGPAPVVLANLNYLVSVGPLRGYDLTPVGFALMGAIFYFSTIKQRLLSVTPISPAIILDGITDGIVVLDEQNNIVECNLASEKFLTDTRANIIGKPAESVLAGYPNLAGLVDQSNANKLELELDKDSETFLIESREIADKHQQVAGRLLSFKDITLRKQVEDKEKEQRQLAEAYRDVMVTLTSTLEFDEVLDRIMENIHKVMPYGMTNLVLIGEDGIGRVVRCIGYENEDFLHWVQSVEFIIDEVVTYRKMIETGKPIIVPDTHKVDFWVKKDDLVHSYMGAPIQIKGHTLGFINQDHADPDFYTPEQAERLQTFADLAAIALENARLFKLTQDMAIMDELTRLYNRRYFFQLAAIEVKRSLRFTKPCSLVIFDVDNFKDINDMYGHPVGDQALKNVASTLLSRVREVDICGRYGGDEFCILLPETNLTGATNLTQRILETFRTLQVTNHIFSTKITASFGIAELDDSTQTVDDLLSHADYALYQAKQKGRDRIEVWTGSNIT